MKQKTKKLLKMLSILLAIFILFEFVFSPQISFAADDEEEINPMDAILGVVDGIVGIFLNLFNTIPVLIGGCIQMVAAGVANIGGRINYIPNNGRHII